MDKIKKGNWYLRGNEKMKVVSLYKDDISQKAVCIDENGIYRMVDTKGLKG